MEKTKLKVRNSTGFIQRLSLVLQEPLPGLPFQRKMAPQARALQVPEALTPRRAAVLLPLYPDQGSIQLLLLQRPEQLNHHAGEIGFPGGGVEPDDPSLIHTALRETHEELGIAAEAIQVLGSLTPLYIPPSQNLVYPFVGWIPALPPLHPEPQEVARVYALPLEQLLHPTTLHREQWWLQGELREVPCYRYREVCIWGATAMILSEFFEVVQRSLTKTD